MPQNKKVTMKDIAEKLDVSIVTVSKALAGKEGVGDKLREEIKEVATQLGYVFKKNTGGIASGSTGGGKYADIYVEGRETQHIIVVKETGRCYLR